MSKTILIIEDNPSVVATMKNLLEIEGYTVHTAENGKDGIEKLKGLNDASLILLDMMMPVMNGWHFLDFQRSNSRFSKIPVVIVSAFAESAKSVKPQDFIPKPVNLQTLLNTVQKYCA